LRSPWSWWRDTNLAGKLDVVIVSVLLPVLIVTAWLGSLAGGIRAQTETAGRYRQTAFATYDLKVALLNIETGYRGYALTGLGNFLEPYNSGLRSATLALNRIRQYNAFPTETAVLEADVADYTAWAAATLKQVRVRGGLPLDLQRSLFEEGKTRFDRLRDKLNAFTDQSLAFFDQNRIQVVNGLDLLSVLPWSALALILVGAIVVRVGLQRLILSPLNRLESATSGLANGQSVTRLTVNSSDEIGRLTETFNQTAAALEQRTKEWERSNRELEQFAYVASHDLQEPLRMVSSYAQLLQKRYKGQLDERADTYIHYAVDGANRMQALIQDLLQYSRAGSRQAPLVAVDAGAVVADALRNLEVAIRESGARVQVGALPKVAADRGQLLQVFQNLIGNALKFRRDGVQHLVEVSATKDGEMWRFCVADNGIGIQAEYFERIFVIFQRLHAREEFAGSGIGLAICQRIIERHGGRIWLESEPDQGTRFYFTLRPADTESGQP
jgi:signal transduction histidine kinase